MSEADRRDWDRRYTAGGVAPLDQSGPPPVFAAHEDLFPATGNALELACGRGRGAVWLAGRGLEYQGIDVSPVAIDLARKLVAHHGLSARCRFEVHDLDRGLPDGPQVDLLFCYLFRDPTLDRAIIERIKPGGVLATAALSEVGAGPGRFRARPGELRQAYSSLGILADGEGDGIAWLIGRRRE
ncbi:MAG TPA: class I SAM-dependent methyltransferase [Acidimicrobiia bacterium]|nr:class I SAM-dependent methyltransferase [Acidimicrobiia bacterium]